MKSINQHFLRKRINEDIQSVVILVKPYCFKILIVYKYIRFVSRLIPGIEIDDSFILQTIDMTKERVQSLIDIVNYISFFLTEPNLNSDLAISSKLKCWKVTSESIAIEFIKKLESLSTDDFTKSNIKSLLNNIIKTKKVPKPQVLQPLRYLLTGNWEGLLIEDIVFLLGKDRSVKRLNKSLSELVVKPL